MINPLKKYIGVEERSDGVYVKVDRAVRDSVDFGVLLKALRTSYVLNCNVEKLQDIFTRARGVFEKLGEKFDYYDPRLDSFIDVKAPTQLIGYVKVSSNALAAGIVVTPHSIHQALNRKGIRFGIDEETVNKIIKEGTYDQDVLIAEGMPPEPGIDGSVKLEIKIDPSCQPKIGPDGKADFRNIQSFTAVSEGDILARRIPPRPGKSGMSVSGDEIPSPPGKDEPLPAGKNTIISEDGFTLTAAKDGVLYIKDKLICVGELLHIGKDVDFSIGNVKYSGDVVIKGNVHPGFTIEADGNVSISGEVEASKIISRHGSVSIAKGIIGKNNTEIFANKDVEIDFAQDASITANGRISFTKHILHCNIKCSVLFSDGGRTASVVGGNVTVFDHVEVPRLGNSKHIETQITIEDKEKLKIEEKITELTKVREALQSKLEPVSKEIKSKTRILSKLGKSVTDRHKLEIKEWVDAFNELTMKVKYVEKNIHELEEALNNSDRMNGYINVSESIFQGVVLNFYNRAIAKITSEGKSGMFIFENGKIKSKEKDKSNA